MTTTLMPLVKQQFNQNGIPVAGGKLFVYFAGTTNKATSYTDSTGDTPNTNPVILDANGQASVWMNPSQAYKFILSPPTDTDPPTNPFWTVDNITSPAPVAVGNMTDEKGSGGTPGFAANVDFTPGTTTTLTLSQNYGSAANLWVSFDADEQGADSFSIGGTNNETLTFNAPIPAGINKVFVKGGTALTVGTPGNGTITDASLVSGSKVYNRAYDMVDVKDWGAKGDGVSNDTNAFLAAASTGRKIYVPAGTYNVNQTITLNNQHMYGEGQNATFFRWTGTNLTDTAIILGALGSISDMFLSFNNADGSSICTGFEVQGQRVMIDVGAGQFQLQRGGGIRRVKIGECGTGIYNQNNTNTSVFSAEFCDIEIQNFTYAGLLFLSPTRTGNVYRNLYINSPKWPSVTTAFSLQGEESESSIDQINVESMIAITPISLSGCRACHIGTIHFEECVLAQNSAGMIFWDASSGKIESLTIYYCNIRTTDWSIIKFGSNVYGGATFNPETVDMLQIGTFHLKGLNDGSFPSRPGSPGLTGLSQIWFLERPVESGPQFCQIDRYVWNTFQTDQAVYEAFPADPQANISFILTADGPINIGASIPTTGFSAWWVRNHNGSMDQGGPFTIGPNTTLTVSFPNPYLITGALSIHVNPIDPSTTATYRVSATPVDSHTFQIVNTSSNTINGRWDSYGF